jgi:hypothetical protein
MSLTLSCEKTLAIEFQPDSCLTRSQKERIANAFEENLACHKELAKVSRPAPAWELVALMVLAGVVGGMVLQKQVGH